MGAFFEWKAGRLRPLSLPCAVYRFRKTKKQAEPPKACTSCTNVVAKTERALRYRKASRLRGGRTDMQ